MEELRPDVLDGELTVENQSNVDNRVLAPTELVDDRSDEDEWFEIDETISGSGTGYDPVDPAAE